MSREEIINIFFNNGKIIALRTHQKYLKKHNYYDFLNNYYNDSLSIKETLYRIYHNIDIRPVCKICGKPVTFNTNGRFSIYCSKKCQNSDPVMLLKNKDGVSKSLKKLYKEKGNEILEKRANSLHKHYGKKVNTPFAIKEIQEKAANVILTKYNVSNIFKLPLFRLSRELMQKKSIEYLKKLGYNIEYINNDPLLIKVYNGCPIHGDIYMDWSLFNNRTRNSRKNYITLCPICNPPKNLETSIEYIIKKLLDKYNILYILHNRNIIKPYELDFYLPDYKIAIECNGSYWHSGYDNFIKHNNKLLLCKDNGIKLIYYWSYLIYNNINDVEIDLCNQLNIDILQTYTNNIINVKDNITYCMYSIKSLSDINIDTKFIAIPIDKDILNILHTICDGFPYFVDYRNESIVNNINIDINDIDFLLENTVLNKGISICWTTQFNIYEL